MMSKSGEPVAWVWSLSYTMLLIFGHGSLGWSEHLIGAAAWVAVLLIRLKKWRPDAE